METIGAIDIGGTKIAVGMVSQQGQVLARRECATEAERGPQDALERMIEMLRQTASQAGAAPVGIGIGSTGPVYPLQGTIGDVEFLPGWLDFNLVQALRAAFPLPVVLENDADAAALGEARWGAGRGSRRFIYITVSTGIGAGLVFDGKLYRGVDCSHPEIGHQVVDPAGPPCACGANGCWESLASGTGLMRALRQHNNPAYASAREICQAAEQGDVVAGAAVQRLGYYLGLGLANLITLLVPEVIALGGGVMQSRHLFWQTTQAVVQLHCKLVPAEQVRILPAALKQDTGLIGAASAWLYRREEENLL